MAYNNTAIVKPNMVITSGMKTLLSQQLAPALSQEFNIDGNEIQKVFETFYGKHAKKKATVTKLTKQQLIDLANQRGITVGIRMTKIQIQEKLNNSSIDSDSPVNPPAVPLYPSPVNPPPVPVYLPYVKAKKPKIKPQVNSRQSRLDLENKSQNPVDGDLERSTFTSKQNNTWTFGKVLGIGGNGIVHEVVGKPDMVIKTGLVDCDVSVVYYERTKYGKLKGEDQEKCGVTWAIDSGRLPDHLRKEEYFIVLPRFEKSLKDCLADKELGPDDNKQVLKSILKSLKYMSDKNHIHLDVKPGNIMKRRHQNNNQWFLIDFDCCEKFDEKSEITEDPKKVNNGTPRYMARDISKGLLSRKADLESLVYTIAEMENFPLEWRLLGNYPDEMFEEKEKFFANYKSLNIPEYLKEIITYINQMKPGDTPDYNKLIAGVEKF